MRSDVEIMTKSNNIRPAHSEKHIFYSGSRRKASLSDPYITPIIHRYNDEAHILQRGYEVK